MISLRKLRERENCITVTKQGWLHAWSSQRRLWWPSAAGGPTWAKAEGYHAKGEECLVANDPGSAAAEPQLSLVTAPTSLVDGPAAVLDTNVFPLPSPPVWLHCSDLNHPISWGAQSAPKAAQPSQSIHLPQPARKTLLHQAVPAPFLPFIAPWLDICWAICPFSVSPSKKCKKTKYSAAAFARIHWGKTQRTSVWVHARGG